MDTPGLVSVIIPAYKAEKLIPEALESVARQTRVNWEAWVVEDGWRDGTETIVRSFQARAGGDRFHFVRHEVNLGLAGTRNTGMRSAKGDFIAFLDHDDIWDDHYLELMLGKLIKTGADIVSCPVEIFEDGTGRDLGRYGPTEQELETFPGSLFFRNYMPPSATLMARPVYERIGGFNPAFPVCEDHDYWLRALSSGFRFCHLERILCRYRRTPDQLSAKLARMHLWDARVIRKYWRMPQTPMAARLKHISSIHERLSFTLFEEDPRGAALALVWAWLFWPVRLNFLVRAARLVGRKPRGTAKPAAKALN